MRLIVATQINLLIILYRPDSNVFSIRAHDGIAVLILKVSVSPAEPAAQCAFEDQTRRSRPNERLDAGF